MPSLTSLFCRGICRFVNTINMSSGIDVSPSPPDLPSLKLFSVNETSFENARRFVVANAPALDDFSKRFNCNPLSNVSSGTLAALPPTTTSIVVDHGYGGMVPAPWILDTPFPCLESLVVGNNCFLSNTVITIASHAHLRRVEIGEKSFTLNRDWKKRTMGREGTRLELRDCPALQRLEVGSWSFYDFVAFSATSSETPPCCL